MRIILLLSILCIGTTSFSQNQTGNATVSPEKKPLSCLMADASAEIYGKWTPAAAGIWVGVYGLLPFISELVLGILVMKLMPVKPTVVPVSTTDAPGSITITANPDVKEMSPRYLAFLNSVANSLASRLGTNYYAVASRINSYNGVANSPFDIPAAEIASASPPSSSSLPSVQTITGMLTVLTSAAAYIAEKYLRGACTYEMQ